MSNLNLLVALDQEGIEYPDSFCRDALLERVRLLMPVLEKTLNCGLELDAKAQDATFTCNLGCFQGYSGRTIREYLICMTFSNFGGLCLVWGNNKWINSHEFQISTVEAILREHRFVPVCVDDLRQPYDGVHVEWEGMTWLDRYFAHF
jgi:hypothetical protein